MSMGRNALRIINTNDKTFLYSFTTLMRFYNFEMLVNDEIQVFKNLRPPVPEELILFNVFKKGLVTSVQNFLIFDKIILKILGIIKSH